MSGFLTYAPAASSAPALPLSHIPLSTHVLPHRGRLWTTDALVRLGVVTALVTAVSAWTPMKHRFTQSVRSASSVAGSRVSPCTRIFSRVAAADLVVQVRAFMNLIPRMRGRAVLVNTIVARTLDCVHTKYFPGGRIPTPHFPPKFPPLFLNFAAREHEGGGHSGRVWIFRCEGANRPVCIRRPSQTR